MSSAPLRQRARQRLRVVMIVEVLESIEDRVDSLHIARQIVDRIELVSRHGGPWRPGSRSGDLAPPAEGLLPLSMSVRCGSKIWPGVSRASWLPDDMAGS